MFRASEFDADSAIELEKRNAGGSQMNPFPRSKKEFLPDDIFQDFHGAGETGLRSPELVRGFPK